jgi:hypothetical protein
MQVFHYLPEDCESGAMSDWEEIRRLAADFQRAQLAGSAQKLSERNCIEIVAKLIGEMDTWP